jgi:hypothetical protein
MGIADRLERLERGDEGERENPFAQPLPRSHVRALNMLADLKREGLWDGTTPIEVLEQLMIARGVEGPFARYFAEMMVDLREERLAR